MSLGVTAKWAHVFLVYVAMTQGHVTLFTQMDLLCIADVPIVYQEGPLVGVSNHGIGYLPSSTEAEPVAIPCIVKLHRTRFVSCHSFYISNQKDCRWPCIAYGKQVTDQCFMKCYTNNIRWYCITQQNNMTKHTVTKYIPSRVEKETYRQ